MAVVGCERILTLPHEMECLLLDRWKNAPAEQVLGLNTKDFVASALRWTSALPTGSLKNASVRRSSVCL